MDEQLFKKLIIDLGHLHRKSMDAFVVLEAAHHLMPDDKIDSPTSTRYMVGIALHELSGLQEKIELLGMEVSDTPWISDKFATEASSR